MREKDPTDSYRHSLPSDKPSSLASDLSDWHAVRVYGNVNEMVHLRWPEVDTACAHDM